MNLTQDDKNKLIGRITGLALREAWEPRDVIIHKKGKNLEGVSTDENGQPLQPEKFYGLVRTPELFKVNHVLRLLLIMDEAKDLNELHEGLNGYVAKYSTLQDAQIKWPKHLKLETSETP